MLGRQFAHEFYNPWNVFLEDEIVVKMILSVLMDEAVVVVGQFWVILILFALFLRRLSALNFFFLLIEQHALEDGARGEAEWVHARLVEIEDIGPKGTIWLSQIVEGRRFGA